MARFMTALVGGFLLLTPGVVHAAGAAPAGTWKFTLLVPVSQERLAPLTMLVMFSEGDKGWVGDFLGASLALKLEPKFESLTVKDDNVNFVIKLVDLPVSFDGRIAKDGKKIQGSIVFQGRTSLVDLTPSKLKNLSDKFAAAKETIEQSEGGSDYFDVVMDVLAQCTSKKAKVDDVQAIVDKAVRLSENYGTRWQRSTSVRIASVLADQEAYVGIALEQARQSERMLRPDDDVPTQISILKVLAQSLRSAKKLADLKPIEARIAKLETRDYDDYLKSLSSYKSGEPKGRKNKSDRAVLVELFTGAECDPCVAADLAFDALQTTYKPTEVVALEYHMHVPGPDPLTNSEGMERAEYYGDKLTGTPSVFFNGKKAEGGGGGRDRAKVKYTSFCETIDALLEKNPGANLQLSATQTGSEITAKAVVSDLAKPGEKVKLYFVLAEERVRYPGGNGQRFHHCVVRAMPGGVKGVALTKAQSEQTVKISLDKVRQDINKYLDAVAKEVEFPNSDRPLALKKLRVIAFIQDDATQEVLQAAQVEVEEKKAE